MVVVWKVTVLMERVSESSDGSEFDLEVRSGKSDSVGAYFSLPKD